MRAPSKLVACALGFLALLVGTGAARCDEPLKIRIGWTAVPIELTPIAFENKAILKHYGKSYVTELEHFAGSGPLLIAFATGDVDIGALSPPAFGNAIVTAGLTQLRIVADTFQDGADGHYSTQFMVRKDGPIHKVEDLKGKVVAVNAFGGAADISLRAMLLKHHMTYKRDYTAIEVQFPNMAAVLADGKVELAATVPPFSYDILDRGIGRPLFTSKDAIGPSQAVFLVARADVIARHRAAFVDFFEDYVRALHWYLASANRQQALANISGFTKRPAAFFSNWVFTDRDFYHDPNGLPNLAMLQNNIKTDAKLNFLKADFDVNKFADVSLIEEAAKRLK